MGPATLGICTHRSPQLLAVQDFYKCSHPATGAQSHFWHQRRAVLQPWLVFMQRAGQERHWGTDFSQKAEPPKEPPVSGALGWRHGLKDWRVWLVGEEEELSTLLVLHYVWYPPGLWVAAEVSTLWSKLGSSAGAVPRAAHGANGLAPPSFSVVAPHRNLGRLPASKA